MADDVRIWGYFISYCFTLLKFLYQFCYIWCRKRSCLVLMLRKPKLMIKVSSKIPNFVLSRKMLRMIDWKKIAKKHCFINTTDSKQTLPLFQRFLVFQGNIFLIKFILCITFHINIVLKSLELWCKVAWKWKIIFL